MKCRVGALEQGYPTQQKVYSQLAVMNLQKEQLLLFQSLPQFLVVLFLRSVYRHMV